MAVLFLEDEIFQDKEQWGRDKDTFISAINKYIETHYTGDDSEQVYALFNPAQVNLLQNFFKGFSVEMYKELNGTVELQIQKKNAKVKEKINKIAEFMGPIDLDDWVYDGMVDGGKNNSQKCDLCPRPVRYAHFAVNKKTSECLRFGCNCAADFFNMDKGRLSSMRTIQAQTLKDIKKIACVVELNKFEDYYKYLGGHTGKVILEEGPEGLKDLMTFILKWGKDGKVVMDGDNCVIQFGDGTKGVKSLQWVKEHIVSCLNADLDTDIYKPLEDRLLERKVLKQEDKTQLNTAGYVKFAMKFVELGLPIPESLMKKINLIVSKTTRQHHPDYIKYAQELLISHNLAKSSLLQKAFTDFIVNYLASSVGAEVRDPELEYWGVRGAGTFHKTVLQWETAMIKLLYLKDFYSLVSQGYMTEEEFNKFLRSKGYRDIGFNSAEIKTHVNRCMKLFMTKKEVIVNPDKSVITDQGYSKYTLKGVDDKISLCFRNKRDNTPTMEGDKLVKVGKRFNSGEFTPETIPVDIGLHYYAMQQSYKEIVNASINPVLNFLHCLTFASGTKEVTRYLCALMKDRREGTIHISSDWNRYYNTVKSAESFKEKLDRVEIDEDFYKEMYNKYKDIIPAFVKDAKELYAVLVELQKNLSKPILAIPAGKTITASNINSDYEDLVANTDKTNKDYFKDYCNLLVAKRGNKKIQQALYEKNLFSLTIYKQLEPYSDMLKDIQESYIGSFQNVEEKRLYSYLKLDILKDTLSRYLNTPDMDNFIKFIAFNYYANAIINDMRADYDLNTKLRRVLTDIKLLETPMKEAMVMDKINELLPQMVLEECLNNRELFESLYEKYKALFINLKNSKGSIKFVGYYNLLNETSPEVEEYIKGKDLVACETFEHKLLTMFMQTGKYIAPTVQFDRTVEDGMKSLLKKTIVYEGIKEITDKVDELVIEGMKKQRAEERRIELEKRIKGPYLDTLKTYLKEHIDFFEVDVDAMRKKYPSKYGYSSDVTIRQKEALKNITFQKGYEESARFIEELNILGSQNWSDGVEDIVNEYKKTSTSDYGKQKIFAEALRAEMYNHKLIYNHFDVSYKVFKNLEATDLTKFEVDELVEIGGILKHYYVFKSQIEYIVGVLEKYNSLTVDFNAEVAKIPEPTKKNIKDIVDNLTDKPDSTGLTGLEKANKVKEHDDFAKLPDYLQSIVSTVCKYKRCTDKQLKHVNTAFTQLGLGNPDEVKVEEVGESAIDEKAYTELAKQIIAHPDVKNAPDLSVKIATTVAKTGRCSEKQAKHLDKAKKVLGL